MIELLNSPVQVYLQGSNALIPIEKTDEYISYWIGSDSTQMKIVDYRKIPLKAVNRLIAGENGFEFFDYFNLPAHANVVLDSDERIEIELQDNNTKEDFPTLWLGVLNDNMMPNYNVLWEFLRPVSTESTAILVLLEEE